MINKYLNLLGLNCNADISDIKKAYRILAKKNHPDKFLDDDEKTKQAVIMAEITEAYRYIIKNFDKIKEIKNLQKVNETKEEDYKIYKTGLIYYNKYFDTFFKLFLKRELITPLEKESCLKKAKLYFSKLLIEYPESIWVSDVKDKIKKIDDAVKTLY